MVKKVALSSMARQAADVIADEVLGYEGPESEWLLGSEDELMAQLGVGRPTLRQAARILEQQRLLVVRRGPHGGLYGRRPNADGVTKAAEVYLRSKRTTFADLARAELILAPEAARRAASNPDRESRERLAQHYATLDDPPPLRQFMRLSTDFQAAIARLSRSPVLVVFSTVLMDLAGQSGGIARFYEDESRRVTTVERHLRIAQAIVDGRSDLASRRMTEHLTWMISGADPATLSQDLEPGRR